MTTGPSLASSIPALVRDSARRYGDLEALVDGDRRWTYSQLDTALLSAVRAAMAAGIEPANRIALWAPNSAEWIFAALGVLGAGGILVPLNTRWKGDEVAYALEKSEASALFVAQGFLAADQLGSVRAVAPHLPALRQLVTLEGTDPAAIPWAEYLSAGDVVDVQLAGERICAVGGDDIADIMFTSGTTGRPKGVILKHGPSIRAFCGLADAWTFRPGDRHLVIPPFFHTFGYKAGWMQSFANGVTVLPQRVFDAEDVLRKVQHERVSILLGPPTVYTDLLNHPSRSQYDLSSLRVAVPSAATVPVELVERLRADAGFEVVLTSYGLTEAHSLVSTCRPGDDAADVARSVGRPIEGVEVMIVGESGQQASPGTAGEIFVRGYNVSAGYWRDPESTAAAIDSGGWLHTGDIGTMDDRGFLAITDRKKDLIIVGGFNVYPAEVERVLLQCPDIAEAAVVASPDDRLGEVPVAFVVPAPGRTIDGDAVLAAMREKVANIKVPRTVQVLDQLPRNASMKVRKTELRDLVISLSMFPPQEVLPRHPG